jgi:hypothetical protein
MTCLRLSAERVGLGVFRACRVGLVALAVSWLWVSAAAMAQTAVAPAPVIASAVAPPMALPLAPVVGMTMQEYQGLNCMAFGSFTAFGVYVYSDVILEALTGAFVNPLLLVPVMATGFAAGCGVGSTMSPGLLWIVNQFR